MRETFVAPLVNRVPPDGPTTASSTLDPLCRVTSRAGLSPLAERLWEIRTWLGGELRDLEEDLATVGRDRGNLAHRAAAHLLGRPGKRIRPLLVHLAARCGDAMPGDAVRHLAVASELVHAATLLHDDVIDLGTERRGAPTARLVYGNPASVLGGDHLLVEALRRVRLAAIPGLLASLLDVIGAMVSAEAIQLERRGGFEPGREIYLEVAAGKTASLFRWAAVAGGSAATLPVAHIEALGAAGLAVGMAFQMADDLLDLVLEQETVGKDTLADLREGKLTWPLIVACEVEPSLVDALREFAAHPQRLDQPRAMARLHGRIVATGCLDATRLEAESRAAAAVAALSPLPDGRAKEMLVAVMQRAVSRTR